MAQVGQSVSVGTVAPETGRYKHSACTNTIILNRGNVVPPCGMANCPNKGANWQLVAILT